MAQDAKAFVFLYAPVKVALIQGFDGIHQLLLDAGGQPPACAIAPIAVGFRPSAAARVDVDADEYIRKPTVGLPGDTGVGRGFCGQVMALQELYPAASCQVSKEDAIDKVTKRMKQLPKSSQAAIECLIEEMLKKK